jgi:hypothetical protein
MVVCSYRAWTVFRQLSLFQFISAAVAAAWIRPFQDKEMSLLDWQWIEVYFIARCPSIIAAGMSPSYQNIRDSVLFSPLCDYRF